MLLTLSTNFDLENDDTHAELIAALPDGRPAMIVNIEFKDDHKITHRATEHATLSHPSIARVILAASDLLESFFVDGDSVWEVEV